MNKPDMYGHKEPKPKVGRITVHIDKEITI